MFIFTYTAALLAIIFAVGAVVLLSRRRDPLALALAGYLLMDALWIGGNAVADVSYTPDILILASQLAYLGGVLNLFCCLVIIDLLVDGQLPSWKRLLIYGFPLGICAILGFSPFAILDVAFPANQPAQIVPGVLYAFTLYLFLAGLTYGIIRLYRSVRRERKQIRRMQLLFVLVGLMLTATGELVFDLILPLLGEFRFYTLGPITSLFFAIGCALAITRYRLLELRIVAKRGMLYSLLLASIVGLYVGIVNTLTFVLQDASTSTVYFSAGLTTVIGVMSAPSIERFFRTTTDHIFFKDTYNYVEAMDVLGKTLATASTHESMVKQIETLLAKLLRAEWVRIDLAARKTSITQHDGTVSIAIPLHDQPIGCIHMGPKRSGDTYDDGDIQFLRTFAYTAANSLSRVSLYEQIKGHVAELEEKVEERTAELKEMQGRQRQMMVELSHNLQTPLTILRVKIDQARHLLHDGERQGLKESVDALSAFIYDLLSLASLENPKTPEQDTRFSLSALVQDVAEEIAIIGSEAGISVHSSITPNASLTGNEKQIREALLNIASNAVKYIGTGARKEITFSLEKDPKEYCIRVSDTGMGIPEDTLPHIFDRFYRAERTYGNIRGTGLGLAIVKRIVERHKGTITATSVVHEGTTLEISLPRS